jgi:probable phosphoglycerate mutase
MDLPFDRARRRRVYLMRHAEAEYIRSDGTRAPDSRVVSLTSKGRSEAAAMAELLREVTFDRAVTSSLPRTRETAEIILAGRDLTPEIVPDLDEIRGGDAIARAKMSPSDYAYAMFKASEPDTCYAMGEKFSAFVGRVLPAFNRIVAEDGWSTALIVAHGGVNRAILTDITCGGLRAFGAFEQDSCCLNVIDIDICRDTAAPLRRIMRGVNITADDPAKTTRRLTSMEGLAKRFAEMAAAKPSQPM